MDKKDLIPFVVDKGTALFVVDEDGLGPFCCGKGGKQFFRRGQRGPISFCRGRRGYGVVDVEVPGFCRERGGDGSFLIG